MTTFGHALLGILPAWRRIRDPHLPLWAFAGSPRRVERLHVLRCTICDRRARCRTRPARRCPNAELFK